MEDISGYDPFEIRKNKIKNGELTISILEKVGHEKKIVNKNDIPIYKKKNMKILKMKMII